MSLNADEGETIRTSLPEMGLEGPAVIEDIEPCPDIQDGPGRIVLATTGSCSASIVQLVFEGEDEPLRATARHRFYSEDRKSWVQAGRLRAGEQLRTQSGLVTLKEVLPVPGTYRVYNLEVETDHCYFVTDDAVLVHNANPCTGQLHHVISKRAHTALQDHPNLKGMYEARDPRFATRAKDKDSHFGYEGWHRDLDAEFAEWLYDHPEATPEQFEKWLKDRYKKPDLRKRFPEGL